VGRKSASLLAKSKEPTASTAQRSDHRTGSGVAKNRKGKRLLSESGSWNASPPHTKRRKTDEAPSSPDETAESHGAGLIVELSKDPAIDVSEYARIPSSDLTDIYGAPSQSQSRLWDNPLGISQATIPDSQDLSALASLSEDATGQRSSSAPKSSTRPASQQESQLASILETESADEIPSHQPNSIRTTESQILTSGNPSAAPLAEVLSPQAQNTPSCDDTIANIKSNAASSPTFLTQPAFSLGWSSARSNALSQRWKFSEHQSRSISNISGSVGFQSQDAVPETPLEDLTYQAAQIVEPLSQIHYQGSPDGCIEETPSPTDSEHPLEDQRTSEGSSDAWESDRVLEEIVRPTRRSISPRTRAVNSEHPRALISPFEPDSYTSWHTAVTGTPSARGRRSQHSTPIMENPQPAVETLLPAGAREASGTALLSPDDVTSSGLGHGDLLSPKGPAADIEATTISDTPITPSQPIVSTGPEGSLTTGTLLNQRSPLSSQEPPLVAPAGLMEDASPQAALLAETIAPSALITPVELEGIPHSILPLPELSTSDSTPAELAEADAFGPIIPGTSSDSEVEASPAVGSGEYLVTLPLVSNLRTRYIETIMEHRLAIANHTSALADSSTKEPDDDTANEIDQLFETLLDMVDLPAFLEGLELSREYMVKHSTNSNSKFSFIYELLSQVKRGGIVILSRPGRVADFLEAILTECRDKGHNRSENNDKAATAESPRAEVQFTLATTDSDPTSLPTDVRAVICFDQKARTSVLWMRYAAMEDSRPLMLTLITTYTLEHIDRLLPALMDPLERRNALVIGTWQSRGYVINSNITLPHEAADIFAGIIDYSSSDFIWHPEPLPDTILDVYAATQNRASPEHEVEIQAEEYQLDPHGRKRVFDGSDDEDISAKRPRMSEEAEPPRQSLILGNPHLSEGLKNALGGRLIAKGETVEISLEQLESLAIKASFGILDGYGHVLTPANRSRSLNHRQKLRPKFATNTAAS
jgi:hypothetical protein